LQENCNIIGANRKTENQIGAEQNRSRTRKLVRLATKQNKTKQKIYLKLERKEKKKNQSGKKHHLKHCKH
jgi:hypothetical protein